MPELSRAQLAVYAAVAVAMLLLGAKWIRAGEATEPAAFESAGAEAAAAEGDAATFEPASSKLVVHVAGEVSKPGVYRMPADSRVTDAIERAGGVTRGAVADAINLAAKLADGQQVIVPAKHPAPASAPGGAGPAGADDGPISLGSATAEQLETIEGIGPVTAGSIIEFRDEQGGVASVDELDEVSGIGPATMEALRSRLQP